MLQYTTGEMAKLCKVSVRTVQFYDTKGLLPPAAQTEGGRRLYSEEDLNKLNMICLYKSLGLSLASIKEIMDNEDRNQLLILLLTEHEKALEEGIRTRQDQLKSIELIKENLNKLNFIPVNSMSGIEKIMENQKKKKITHVIMLIIGILMNTIQLCTLFLWIFKGI